MSRHVQPMFPPQPITPFTRTTFFGLPLFGMNLNLLKKQDLIMFQGWPHPPSIDRSLLWSWFWCVRKVPLG